MNSGLFNFHQIAELWSNMINNFVFYINFLEMNAFTIILAIVVILNVMQSLKIKKLVEIKLYLFN